MDLNGNTERNYGKLCLFYIDHLIIDKQHLGEKCNSYTLHLPFMNPTPALHAPYMCSLWTLYMYASCTLHLHFMVHVHFMHTTSALYVKCVLHAHYGAFAFYAPYMSHVSYLSRFFILPPCSLFCVINLQIFLYLALLSFFFPTQLPITTWMCLTFLHHMGVHLTHERRSVEHWDTSSIGEHLWFLSSHIHMYGADANMHTCSTGTTKKKKKNFLMCRKVLIPELVPLSKGPYLVPWGKCVSWASYVIC